MRCLVAGKHRIGTCLKCHRRDQEIVARDMCGRCYGVFVRGKSPLYEGPCLEGCGVWVKNRSGFAPLCRERLWHQESRRSRIFREAAGIDMTLSKIIHTLGKMTTDTTDEQVVVQGLGRMLRMVFDGDLYFYRRKKKVKPA